jgi:hypothetical protein
MLHTLNENIQTKNKNVLDVVENVGKTAGRGTKGRKLEVKHKNATRTP